MSFNQIKAGHDVPNDINVVIEIPAHAPPVKYEVDKDTGSIHVDRFMPTAMFYPCNYGYIPQTLAEDGDPTDVLVMTPVPVVVGSVIRARPIAMLNMTDESGVDVKILAVPIEKLCQQYRDIKTYHDVPELLLKSIEHFFEHYKDLEPEKWVKLNGWVDADAAKAEITASLEHYSN